VYARLHTIETTPEQYEHGLQLIKEQLLPWARESTGFCGLIGLVDRAKGTSLVLTLWADEETLDRSADAGDELSRLAAEATGATRQSLEDFEVGIFEVLRTGD
jgi:hypothetical protein